MNEIPTMAQAIEQARREALSTALRVAGGNRAQAAALLGVAVHTVYNQLDQFPEIGLQYPASTRRRLCARCAQPVDPGGNLEVSREPGA